MYVCKYAWAFVRVCVCLCHHVYVCVCVCRSFCISAVSRGYMFSTYSLHGSPSAYAVWLLFWFWLIFFLFYLIHTLTRTTFFTYLCFYLLLSLSHVIITSYTGGTLLNLLSKFATCVSDGVDGKGSTDGGVEMNDLYGGARISYIFNEVRMRAYSYFIPSSASSPQIPTPHPPTLLYTRKY